MGRRSAGADRPRSKKEAENKLAVRAMRLSRDSAFEASSADAGRGVVGIVY